MRSGESAENGLAAAAMTKETRAPTESAARTRRRPFRELAAKAGAADAAQSPREAAVATAPNGDPRAVSRNQATGSQKRAAAQAGATIANRLRKEDCLVTPASVPDTTATAAGTKKRNETPGKRHARTTARIAQRIHTPAQSPALPARRASQDVTSQALRRARHHTAARIQKGFAIQEAGSAPIRRRTKVTANPAPAERSGIAAAAMRPRKTEPGEAVSSRRRSDNAIARRKKVAIASGRAALSGQRTMPAPKRSKNTASPPAGGFERSAPASDRAIASALSP